MASAPSDYHSIDRKGAIMSIYRFPAYVFSQAMHAGTVAAHNHLSPVIVGDVPTTAEPMRGWLATGVSGGTLEAVSSIGKTRSALPDPVGEIRTEGMAATLGAAWFNSPPLLGVSKTSAPFVHQVPAAIPGGSPITLLPGESTVLRTDAGDVDQRWNLSIAWLEVG